MYRMIAVSALLLAIVCLEAHGEEPGNLDAVVRPVEVELPRGKYFILWESSESRLFAFRLLNLDTAQISYATMSDSLTPIAEPAAESWTSFQGTYWNAYEVPPNTRAFLKYTGGACVLQIAVAKME